MQASGIENTVFLYSRGSLAFQLQCLYFIIILTENYRRRFLPIIALSIIMVAAVFMICSHHDHSHLDDNHCAICKFATDLDVSTVVLVYDGHIAVEEQNIIPSNSGMSGVQIVRGFLQRAPPHIS